MALLDAGLALKAQAKKDERKLTPWAGVAPKQARHGEQASAVHPRSFSSHRNPIQENFAAVRESATHAEPVAAVYQAMRLERASCRTASFPSHSRA